MASTITIVEHTSNKGMFERLKKHSKETGISINSIVNNYLKKYSQKIDKKLK